MAMRYRYFRSCFRPGEARLSVTRTVTGVDGCAGGWVAVTLAARAGDAPGGGVLRVAVAPTLAGLALGRPPATAVVGLDMPLGLLAEGWRDADRLARGRLGRRGVTVFAIPPRPVWLAAGYAEALAACRALTGQGLSAQAWGLRGKLLEADAFRRGSAVALREVHPELSFAALAGGPLPDSKHTAAGLAVRRELLAAAGLVLPARVAGAAAHDLLDAAAVAWSARRIAAGDAVTLTSAGQRADDGGEIAIRF
jgi:predicted RNase H-like nuclease